MNWKALLITIGIFIGIAAFAWLCIVLNIGTIVLGVIGVLSGFGLFYLVYYMVKLAIELYNETKQG